MENNVPSSDAIKPVEAPVPTPQIDLDIENLAREIAEAAWDRKALDLEIFDVRGLVSYCDYLVVCSGRSDRQVQAIVQGIQDDLRELGVRYRGVEGTRQGLWALLDYGDIIVHVFHIDEREKYSLERLWSDAPRLALEIPEGLTTDRTGGNTER